VRTALKSCLVTLLLTGFAVRCVFVTARLLCQQHLISGCSDVTFIRAVVAETDRRVGQQFTCNL